MDSAQKRDRDRKRRQRRQEKAERKKERKLNPLDNQGVPTMVDGILVDGAPMVDGTPMDGDSADRAPDERTPLASPTEGRSPSQPPPSST